MSVPLIALHRLGVHCGGVNWTNPSFGLALSIEEFHSASGVFRYPSGWDS